MIKIIFISYWKCIYSLIVYVWCICIFREFIIFFMGKIEILYCNNDKILEIFINIY